MSEEQDALTKVKVEVSDMYTNKVEIPTQTPCKKKGQYKINRNLMRVNRSSGFPTRSDTNRLLQSQMQARCMKFWLLVE